MEASTVKRAESQRDASGLSGISLVDCDVHPAYKTRWQDELAPYLSKAWAKRIGAVVDHMSSDTGSRYGMGYDLPFNGFYPIPQSGVRIDLMRPGLPPPCSDADIAGRDLFDGYGIDRAILVPISSFQHLHNPLVVATIGEAANKHLEEHWLAKDRRWRSLIQAPWVSPERTVKEIERCAPNDQWVGVSILSGDRVMGHEMFWPIYEACEHYGLAVQVHVSGIDAMYHSGGSFAGGLPLYHMDYRVAFTHADQNNLASMISAGVFERFPKLRFVMAECGWAWLPQLMWQMDAYWKGNREDTPWLTRPPSEYIFEHVRFTTQPFIEPPKGKFVDSILEMVRAEQTMMFSTDYPHWDADVPTDVLKRIPEHMRERIAYQNALETYGARML